MIFFSKNKNFVNIIHITSIVLCIAHILITITTKAFTTPHIQCKRIVSLSPSITAMIIDLDAEHLLVGVTQYHPPLSRPIPVVGSITNPNIELILSLQPDTIFASCEDAPTQKIEQITQLKTNVYILPSASTFESLCTNYRTIAQIINKSHLAKIKLHYYSHLRQKLTKNPTTTNALILLSTQPYIAVASNSYISNIFLDAGIVNYLTYRKTRYPIIQKEYLFDKRIACIIVLGDQSLPDDIVTLKNIIYIPYEEIYYYSPYHYCVSLQKIILTLENQHCNKVQLHMHQK